MSEPLNELIVIPKETALEVFTKEGSIEPYLEQIKAAVTGIVPDLANYDPSYEDRDFPRWPMRIEAQDYRNGFQPSLVIEAPDGVTIKCLQRSGGDED